MPKYLKGLADMAMDKASRMKRARELDFDVDTAYTHTGQTDITKINKGGLGNIFDGVFAIEGGGYSLGGDIESDFFLRNNRLAGAGDADLDYDKTIEFLKKEYPGEDDDFIESIYEITAGDEDIFDKDVNPLSEYGFDDTGEASWEAQRIRGQIAADQGFDAITMNDELGDASILIPHGTGARRTNAAFDPEKKDSSDLLAGLGGLGVGLGATGAALTPEEAEAGVHQRQQDQDLQALNSVPQDLLYQGGDVGSIQGDPAFPSSDSPPNETMLKLADYLYGADNRMKGLGDFLPFEGMANLLSKYAQDQPADWWDYFDAMP